MKKIFNILLIFILFSPANLLCQSHYEVSRAKFSSSKYDEFSPTKYKDQIVFCSNMESDLLITYQNKQKKSLFSLFKVISDPESDTQNPVLFSPQLVTPFNDGPASFHPDCTLLVYSRNLDVKAKAKNTIDLNNKLGLFFAELIDGEWAPMEAFPFNHPDYTITTPCYSAHGDTLYFGSDMPGGYGGTDLYWSIKSEGTWSTPVNFGEKVNTPGNELYPFMALNGNLFFASDGRVGLGKKDIFLTRRSESDWITPIHLEAPINSPDDDFGLVTNNEFSEGYFSTDRDRSDDIYRFKTLLPQLIDCDTLLINQYCFEFWDDDYLEIDSLPVIYEWEFSDGAKVKGQRVKHCLPGAGKHWAKLNIIDNTTSKNFVTQTFLEFELEDYVQPFITSSEAGISKKSMKFSGLNSNLPGYSIETYIWDFGDGTLDTGAVVQHQFDTTGAYAVKLGLHGYAEGSLEKETRCVVRTITIVGDNQALAMLISGIEPTLPEGVRNPKSSARNTGKEFSSATAKTYILADLPAETIARIKGKIDNNSDANFEFQRSKLTENSNSILNELVSLMREYPDFLVEIVAHTNQSDTFEANLKTSKKRAQEIVDFMTSKGINPRRLKGIGYGESRPITTKSTEEGSILNSRIEILILN